MHTTEWWKPRRLIIPLTIGAIFLLALGPLIDPDLYWHLANGRLIHSTGVITRSDPFSFTVAGKEWICHEWLTEIGMYALYNSFGPLALVIAGAAAVALAFAFAAKKTRSSPYVVAFCVLLAAVTSAPSWGARPQMISLFLSSLTLYVAEGGAPLWMLVPLGAVWANLHGGFYAGPVIVGAYAVGEAISAVGSRDRRRWVQTGRLALAAAGMGLAALLNPYGTKLLIYPFQTLTSGAMREYIIEWFSPDFHKLAFQPLLLLLLALLGALAVSSKKPTATQLVLLLGMTYAALGSARHVPLFAIVVAPMLSEQIESAIANVATRWAQAFPRQPANPSPPPGAAHPRLPSRAFGVAFALIVAVIFVAGCVWRLNQVAVQSPVVQRARYPVDALSFMRDAHISGNLFDEYAWGGYLIWQGEKVFVDGRADVYGDDFLREYVGVHRGNVSPNPLLQKYGIERVLIQPSCALATLVNESQAWKKVYEDKVAAVFVRAEAQ